MFPTFKFLAVQFLQPWWGERPRAPVLAACRFPHPCLKFHLWPPRRRCHPRLKPPADYYFWRFCFSVFQVSTFYFLGLGTSQTLPWFYPQMTQIPQIKIGKVFVNL
jgi:hypothetical protein